MTDRLVEIGEPMFVAGEVARAEVAWRAQRRREIRSAVGRRGLAAVAIGFVPALVAYVGGADGWFVVWPVVAVLVVRAGVGRRLRPLKPQIDTWRRWRRTDAAMADALRMSLTAEWTVLWDRRLPDWATPVALLVGPAGVWVLWTARPGAAIELAAEQLVDRFGPLLPDWLVRSHVAKSTAAEVELRRFATGLALTPEVVLSAGDRARLVGYLEGAVPAELAGVPAAWPTNEPLRSRRTHRVRTRASSANR